MPDASPTNSMKKPLHKRKTRNSSQPGAVGSEKRGGTTAIPSYERLSEWRGIERIFQGQNHHAGFLAQSKPIGILENSLPKPSVSKSPLAEITRITPALVVDSVEEAIESVRIALKPHLDQIAMNAATARTTGTSLHSEWTSSTYEKNSKMLFRQYCGQVGIFEINDILWPSFVNWLLARRHTVSENTWYVYKASVLRFLERCHEYDAQIAMVNLKSEVGFNDSDERNGLRGMNRIKKITRDDFERMVDQCQRRDSPNLRNLEYYLRGGIRIGLRPKEYLTSEIRFVIDKNSPLGRQAWLFVVNAKYSNGQANGPVRLINLSDLSNSAIEVIVMCIESARTQTAMNGFDAWLKSLNNAMRTMANSAKTGVTETYTAYATRHQAIANWKSVHDPIEVAALAGHALPGMAQKYYGAQKDAWPKEQLVNLLVRPSGIDVERIKNRIEQAREYREFGRGGLPKWAPEI